MYRVVLFGAGKSSSYLIKKLQEYSTQCELQLSLVDINWNQLPECCKKHKNTNYLTLSVNNREAIAKLIQQQHVVISMLPAYLHITLAKLCLVHKKHLLTASYVSAQMQELHNQASQKGLLFLNEIGVDPGLDHMSALKLINQLKKQGAQIHNFYSHTGGLINHSKTNAWNYKFTWNPKNVILAGAEGASYIKNSQKTSVPYKAIFNSIIPVTINNKIYDSYPNRNSLLYTKKYQLEGVQNFYRGTLRHQGYCEAWNVFVQLGITDDLTTISLHKLATRKDFLNHFLPVNNCIETTFCTQLGIQKTHPIFKKFKFLNFFSEQKKLSLTQGTAANILLHILKEDWQMKPNENDLLVMQHQIDYTLNGVAYCTKSELSVVGENQYYTAMAKTVGAPMFEAALMVLTKELTITGVQIPTKKTVYLSLLEKIQKHGVTFLETTIKL